MGAWGERSQRRNRLLKVERPTVVGFVLCGIAAGGDGEGRGAVSVEEQNGGDAPNREVAPSDRSLDALAKGLADGSVSPTEAPSGRVLFGQNLSPEKEQQLVHKVQEWMKSKSITKCVLCGQGDYDIENFRLVFLPGATTGAEVGRGKPSGEAGRRADRRGMFSEISEGLRRLRNQLRGVRNAAQFHQAMQLTCQNCGHIILLDGTKIGATVGFIDPLTESS